MASPITHPATGATVNSSLHTVEVAFQGFTVSDALKEMIADTATWRELLVKYHEELKKDTFELSAAQEKACGDIQAFGEALKEEQEKAAEDMGEWLDARAKKGTERDVERRRILANAQEKLDAAMAAIHAMADRFYRPRTDDVACDVDDDQRATLRAKMIADADAVTTSMMITMTSTKANAAKAEELIERARSSIRILEREVAFEDTDTLARVNARLVSKRAQAAQLASSAGVDDSKLLS